MAEDGDTDHSTFGRAKAFRRTMTPPEARLWTRLRGSRFHGFKFRRQHPVGPYILDFYCSEARLAVEVDGQVHEQADRIVHDRRRTAFLGDRGIRVIRLRAVDVRNELDGVLDFLLAMVRERVATATTASPPPGATRLSSPSPRSDGEVIANRPANP